MRNDVFCPLCREPVVSCVHQRSTALLALVEGFDLKRSRQIHEGSATTVYLCGGINKLKDLECKAWREKAKSLLKDVTWLDPLRRDFRASEKGNEAAIVKGDLIDIDASDYILVNGSRPSWGTAMEIFYAFRRGKKVVVFGVCQDPSPWLAYHSTVMFDGLQGAVGYIESDISC